MLFRSQQDGREEEGANAEKEVLILRSEHGARLEGWQRAPIAAPRFQTREDELLTMRQ